MEKMNKEKKYRTFYYKDKICGFVITSRACMQLGERESNSTGVAKERLPKGWDEAVCFGCAFPGPGSWPVQEPSLTIQSEPAGCEPLKLNCRGSRQTLHRAARILGVAARPMPECQSDLCVIGIAGREALPLGHALKASWGWVGFQKQLRMF